MHRNQTEVNHQVGTADAWDAHWDQSRFELGPGPADWFDTYYPDPDPADAAWAAAEFGREDDEPDDHLDRRLEEMAREDRAAAGIFWLDLSAAPPLPAAPARKSLLDESIDAYISQCVFIGSAAPSREAAELMVRQAWAHWLARPLTPG